MSDGGWRRFERHQKKVAAGALAEEKLAERLGVLNKMLTQSGEALDALDEELEKLLERKADATEPARPSLTEDDEAAVFAALEFYGDEDHYERQSGNKPSLIARDRGKRARKVLDALDGRGDNANPTD